MGGNITAESQSGSGSTFRFTATYTVPQEPFIRSPPRGVQHRFSRRHTNSRCDSDAESTSTYAFNEEASSPISIADSEHESACESPISRGSQQQPHAHSDDSARAVLNASVSTRVSQQQRLTSTVSSPSSSSTHVLTPAPSPYTRLSSLSPTRDRRGKANLSAGSHQPRGSAKSSSTAQSSPAQRLLGSPEFGAKRIKQVRGLLQRHVGASARVESKLNVGSGSNRSSANMELSNSSRRTQSCTGSGSGGGADAVELCCSSDSNRSSLLSGAGTASNSTSEFDLCTVLTSRDRSRATSESVQSFLNFDRCRSAQAVLQDADALHAVDMQAKLLPVASAQHGSGPLKLRTESVVAQVSGVTTVSHEPASPLPSEALSDSACLHHGTTMQSANADRPGGPAHRRVCSDSGAQSHSALAAAAVLPPQSVSPVGADQSSTTVESAASAPSARHSAVSDSTVHPDLSQLRVRKLTLPCRLL